MSTELRVRVQAAAERLRYVPNLAARTLAARRSGLLGIVLETLSDPLVAAIATACERRLGEAGYGVMIASTRGLPEETLRAARSLLARGAQALVFVEAGDATEVISLMAGRGIPWLSVAEPKAQSTPAALSVGRQRGAALAALYLLGLGHRRFGVIAPSDPHRIADAVRQAVEASAATVLSDETLSRGEDLDATQAAVRQLLDRELSPTGVICGNDAQALAVTRECALRGMGVPERISVVGFGDAEFARRASPSLSTIRVASAQLGACAAESLLAMVEGLDAPRPEAALKLIARESTGPAPR